jgi:hypothetical protein
MGLEPNLLRFPAQTEADHHGDDSIGEA